MYCNGFYQRVARQQLCKHGPLLGYATIEEAVFSVWSAPDNSRTTGLCNPFLSNETVNTSTIIGILYEVRAEGL
jgi:hypothetical protein